MNYVEVLDKIINITICVSFMILIILMYKILFLDFLDRHKLLDRIINVIFIFLIIFDVFLMIFVIIYPNAISIVTSLFEKIFGV